MNKKLERANDLYNILPEEGKQKVLNFAKALLTAETESKRNREDKKQKNHSIRSTKLIKYKHYIGSIEYSEEDKMYFGKIQGIDSVVGYGGETISELEEMFRESVDEFVEGYKENKLEPPVSYKELEATSN